MLANIFLDLALPGYTGNLELASHFATNRFGWFNTPTPSLLRVFQL